MLRNNENGTRWSARLSGWTVYILYPTDRSGLNPYLNQNRIGLFLSPNQLILLVLSQLVHNFLKYVIYCFWSHLSMVKNHLIFFAFPYLNSDLRWNWLNSTFPHTQLVHQVSSKNVSEWCRGNVWAVYPGLDPNYKLSNWCFAGGAWHYGAIFQLDNKLGVSSTSIWPGGCKRSQGVFYEEWSS